MKKVYSHKGYKVTASSKEDAVKELNSIFEYEAFGMSNLFPNKTGLDVPIYVDDNMTYKKGCHGKRIKFKGSLNCSNNFRNYSVMKLNGEVIEESLPKKVSDRVKSSVIEGIKNFVLNNFYALSNLADKAIDIADFLSVMIKGKDKASNDVTENQKSQVDRIVEENKKY